MCTLATKPPPLDLAISKSDVERLARLAHISIDPEEVDSYSSGLSRILDLIDEMKQTNTDGVPPMAHPQDIRLRLREDQATEPDLRELFQSTAPSSDRGLYLVPKVLE